jgi:ribonuclease P protein component
LTRKALLRLKTQAQFQVLLGERALAKSEHFALHRHGLDPSAAGMAARPTFLPGLWVGAMVPKRWAKRSVTRHAIKRQIYTVAQDLLPAHDCAAYLVRLRSGFTRQQFHSSSSELLKQAVHAELSALMARVPAALTPPLPPAP